MPCRSGYEDVTRFQNWVKNQQGALETCLKSLPQAEQDVFKATAVALTRTLSSSESMYSSTDCISTRYANLMRAYVRILMKACGYTQGQADLTACRRELEQLGRELEAMEGDYDRDMATQAGEEAALQREIERRDEEIRRLMAQQGDSAPVVQASAPAAAPKQGVSWGIAIGAAVATGMVGYVVARFMR